MIKRWIKAIKSGDCRKFYKSIDWRIKRKIILDRDNKECQKCKGNGAFHIAQCVHHIQSLSKSPELALTDSNLISLCNSCHNEEHPEKLPRKKNSKKFMNDERW